MVDVTHDGHHRRTELLIFLVLGQFDFPHRFLFEREGACGRSELTRQFLGQFQVKRLVDGRHDLAVKQLLNHKAGFNAELFSQFLDRDAFADRDFFVDDRQRGRTYRTDWFAKLAFRLTLTLLGAEISLRCRTPRIGRAAE